LGRVATFAGLLGGPAVAGVDVLEEGLVTVALMHIEG